MNEPRNRSVDDFFAAHRDRVVEHPADDQTWEAITTRAREVRGRSRGMWFLGGAVAASAAAVAVFVATGLGDPTAEPTLPAGPASTDVTAGPSPAAPTEETPEQDARGTVTLPPADLSAGVLHVHEPTGDESDLRAAQFGYDCDAGTMEWDCPGLAVSEDAGQTWQPRVDMFSAGYYRSVAARESIWMWGPGEDAAGGRPGVPAPADGLVRSDDGGRTWVEVPTRGLSPIGVESFRSTLVVVTQGCAGGAPQTCAEVVITDVEADDATDGRRLITLRDLPQPEAVGPGTLPSARLTATYDAVYVAWWGGTTYRIADGEEVATLVEPPAEGCRLSASPESPDALVSWCPDSGSVHSSPDGGRTWRQVEDVPGEQVHGAASNDGTHLVVATDDGVYAGTGGEWERTLDGVGPMAGVTALGGEAFRYGGPYGSFPDADPELSSRWTSEDGGRTWAEQPRIEIDDAG